jgi:hypothetical protein
MVAALGPSRRADHWAFGHSRELPEDTLFETASLYDTLEYMILPMFYGRAIAFTEVMRSPVPSAPEQRLQCLN